MHHCLKAGCARTRILHQEISFLIFFRTARMSSLLAVDPVTVLNMDRLLVKLLQRPWRENQMYRRCFPSAASNRYVALHSGLVHLFSFSRQTSRHEKQRTRKVKV